MSSKLYSPRKELVVVLAGEGSIEGGTIETACLAEGRFPWTMIDDGFVQCWLLVCLIFSCCKVFTLHLFIIYYNILFRVKRN